MANIPSKTISEMHHEQSQKEQSNPHSLEKALGYCELHSV